MGKTKQKEELWDLLDRDGHPTGRTHRRGDPLAEGEYHQIVHAVILNSKDQMLIQRRQPWKKGWPNMWDISTGGCAEAGETSTQAIFREVQEELGITLDLEGKRPAMTITYDHGFDDYYFFYLDVEIDKLKLQKEEVREVKWATKEEILQLQEQGLMVSYLFTEQFFQMREHDGAIAGGEDIIHFTYAEEAQIPSWMNLVEIMEEYFPGLNMENYQETLRKFIAKKEAICMMEGKRVVAALLFSISQSRLCFLAVHPDFRRKGLATTLVKEMTRRLSDCQPVVVDTYRQGDPIGTAARAFYQNMGFEPGELIEEYGYPEQVMIRKRGQ